MKTERKGISKEQKEAEKQRQFDLKQQKRKSIPVEIMMSIPVANHL